MRIAVWTIVLATAAPSLAQQIYDIWQTTWERSKLLSYTNLGSAVNFVSPSGSAQAEINVQDGNKYQTVYGGGATLTDSSAQLLNNLKNQNSNNYWNLLRYLFDPTDGANSAGLSYLRVPLGASDFSANTYTFDDTNGDTGLNSFNINRAPSYLFSVINDIRSINSIVRIHVLPWSPPAWMKDSGTTNGGNFVSSYTDTYARYLLKAVQGFQSKGIVPYAISIQNEPENSNPTYPTTRWQPSQEAAVGNSLRTLLNNNGLGGVKVIGYEHNWDHAGAYPVQLMNSASGAFAGVAFHCYGGDVSQQDSFHNAYPNKEIYFTECSGTMGSDWWSDIKWYIDHIYAGSIERYASVGLMWNLVLDGNGNPKLPGTDSCANPPCRGVATVNNDGSYSLNQEFYAMSHTSKAVIPRDSGGPFGRRIGVSLSGDQAWGLRVTAFETGRRNSADWNRYSLVVLNWHDNDNGAWNPQPVTAHINFRGVQATYTFPVGVTTLWWYGAANGFAKEATVAANVSVSTHGVNASVSANVTAVDGTTRKGTKDKLEGRGNSAKFRLW